MYTLNECVGVLGKPKSTIYWYIKNLGIQGVREYNEKTNRKAIFYNMQEIEQLRKALNCGLDFSEPDIKFKLTDKYKKNYIILKLSNDKCGIYKKEGQIPEFLGWATFDSLERDGIIEILR